jgi:hypothetical protein
MEVFRYCRRLQFTLIAENEEVLLLAGVAPGFWFNLICDGKGKRRYAQAVVTVAAEVHNSAREILILIRRG